MGGKSLPSIPTLHQFAQKTLRPTRPGPKPAPRTQFPTSSTRVVLRVNNSDPQKRNPSPPMDANFPSSSSSSPSAAAAAEDNSRRRVPLAEVVAECSRRWFQDTLKEARAGDTAMQILVGQMYYSGYGIARDAQKGRAWISKASKSRSSVWKVSDKPPGYNASDSDSEDVKIDATQEKVNC